MSSYSESDWEADELNTDLIDDVPNQLFVSMLTEPSHMHRSRVSCRKPVAPCARLVKIPVAPPTVVEQSSAGQEPMLTRLDAPSPPAHPDSSESVCLPPRKRARVPLEAKLRSALCTEPAVAASDTLDLDTVVNRIAAAIRGCGDDAGLVAGLVVNGLADPLNGTLRADVLSGAMTPETLVTLNDEDFLNPQRREELQSQRQERMAQRSVDYLERLTQPITTFFTCPACGCKECFANFRNADFVKWQGDDPNPTLLTCTRCSLSFKA